MRTLSFLQEFWAFIALVIPLIAAAIVLGLHLADWHGSEQLVEDIAEHNNAVVVLVQVISVILGFILLQALSAVVKIHLRSSISKRPVSLESARFLNAVSQTKILIAERHIFTTATLLVALLSYIPGAIWAGAISPRVVLRAVDRNVQIPYYPDNYAPSGQVNDYYNTVIQNDKGLFTFDPNRFSGSLLNSARQASNQHVPRAKLDDTGYTFLGRSFGAASNVGLESAPSNSKSLSYSFNQTSIVADARCHRNTFSTFGIAQYLGVSMSNGTSPNPAFLAYTTGQYPNGTDVASMWLYSAESDNLFAIDYNHQLQSRRANVFVASTGSLTSGLSEASYNQTYCEVAFSSHLVQVHVNTTARTIATTRLGEVDWPAYADNLTAQALVALRALTVKDNGVGESEVWRAMQSNTETLYYNTYGDFPDANGNDGYFPEASVSDGLLFQSIEDFITNVLDNNIIMTGACQKEFDSATQLTHGSIKVRSVVFGHPEYQYTIFALTVLIVLFCVCYMVLAHGGTGHQLDFADFANVALNASKGGNTLFERYEERGGYDAVSVRLNEPAETWPGIVYADKQIKAEKTTSQLKAADPADAASVSESLLDGENEHDRRQA